MNAPDAVIADRSAGVVVASAAADALGGPYEFGPPIGADRTLAMTGGGGFGWGPGEWTDDTQMALALLTPLAAGKREVAAVEAGMMAWYSSGPRDVGNQTRAVLGAGAPLAESAARYQLRNPDGAGNAGLMRIGPAALSSPGDPTSIAVYARSTTALTHPHHDCLDASVLWAVAIDHTIHNAPASTEPWDFADALRVGLIHVPTERRERWAALIDTACTRPARDFDNNGWVVHAFQAALATIVQTPVPSGAAPCRHVRMAIEAAVRLGGDTDTVAAIAGSLLGARWGLTAVPLSWRSVLHGKRVYGHPDLHANDLETMARLAARGGKPDKLGWPGVSQLIPYYQRSCPSRPTVVELGGATFGNISGLGSALTAGSDVIVSLCRMGTEDIPAGIEHLVIGLIDTDSSDNPNLPFLLADTADFIATRTAEGRSIYVHCVRAENRTPAVAATLLARQKGGDVDEALQTVADTLGHRPRGFFVAAVRQATSLGDTI
jgi:ADP-ribosyl-[dinitrogen reductase] hydrolase